MRSVPTVHPAPADAEADLFAINASREPEAFASIAVKLGEYRKLDFVRAGRDWR